MGFVHIHNQKPSSNRPALMVILSLQNMRSRSLLMFGPAGVIISAALIHYSFVKLMLRSSLALTYICGHVFLLKFLNFSDQLLFCMPVGRCFQSGGLWSDLRLGVIEPYFHPSPLPLRLPHHQTSEVIACFPPLPAFFFSPFQ